jgi:hypothetical protein
MKKPIGSTLFLFLVTFSFGQTERISAMVDSLRYLKADTLDCRADLYWRIIAQGDKAIPFLIDKLTDTIKTHVKDYCKRDLLNVAEVAKFALDEIAYFPTYLVTKMQFDVVTDGCWSFDNFFFINANKRRYQDSVREWYRKEKPKYKAEKISSKAKTECQKLFGINTYYRWSE